MSYRRIRMDDLFEALEMMIEDLQNDFEESFKEFENFGNEARPLMYGFTMTMDHAGEPVIKTLVIKRSRVVLENPFTNNL